MSDGDDLNHYLEGVNRTGYVLEFEASKLLQNAGWTVINNRYYLDDVTPTPREMDLLAYKATTLREGPSIVTTLLVSCKKQEETVWALLAKERNVADPNVDWTPQHVWTNDPPLEYMTRTPWVESYLDVQDGFVRGLVAPPHRIFAFQELRKGSPSETGSSGKRKPGAPQNDSRIYQSVVSLMKAQAYEKAALPERVSRRKQQRLYSFNLISLVDTDLLRVHFEPDQHVVPISDDVYLSEYIINGEHETARIHFVRWESFPQVLAKYDQLHQANLQYFGALRQDFYTGLPQDPSRVRVYARQLAGAMNARRYFLRAASRVDEQDIYATYDDGVLHIHGVPEDLAIALENDPESSADVSDFLEKRLKYTGAWDFNDDIPF
jgi:hypothetical protein